MNNRVLILPDERQTATASGILLPENKEKPKTGTVVVGNKELKKGDRVLFSLFGLDEVELEGKNYALVSDSAVIGKFL